jgi:hypothetical protein
MSFQFPLANFRHPFSPRLSLAHSSSSCCSMERAPYTSASSSSSSSQTGWVGQNRQMTPRWQLAILLCHFPLLFYSLSLSLSFLCLLFSPGLKCFPILCHFLCNFFLYMNIINQWILVKSKINFYIFVFSSLAWSHGETSFFVSSLHVENLQYFRHSHSFWVLTNDINFNHEERSMLPS